MRPFLYSGPILPDGFRFPQSYVDAVNRGHWPDIEPWSLMALDMPSSLSFYGGMLLKFPDVPLIPFAKICDPTGIYNDGYVVLACFDGRDKAGEPAVRIYDFGRPKVSPLENLGYSNFSDWLAAAKSESARYKAEQDEAEDGE